MITIWPESLIVGESLIFIIIKINNSQYFRLDFTLCFSTLFVTLILLFFIYEIVCSINSIICFTDFTISYLSYCLFY